MRIKRRKGDKAEEEEEEERPDVQMEIVSCAQLQEGIRYLRSRTQSRRIAPYQCFSFCVNASNSFPSPAQNRQLQTQLPLPIRQASSVNNFAFEMWHA